MVTEYKDVDCKKCQYASLTSVPWDHNAVWWCNKFEFEIHNVDHGECMAYESMDWDYPEN